MAEAESARRPETRPPSEGGPRREPDPASPAAGPTPPDEVDEASIESFPASDPPPWTSLTAGAPDRGAEPVPPSSPEERGTVPEEDPTTREDES